MSKSIEELLEFGKEALESKDYKNALNYYKVAADLGNSEAMVCLGNIYNEGFACRRNPPLSLEYFLKASELGNCDGMYGVARAYACGYGVMVEADTAIQWYEKAANNGSIKAMLQIASTYISKDEKALIGNASFFRKNDIETAISWYRKAIEQCEVTDIDSLSSVYYRISSDVFYCGIKDKKIVDFAEECCNKAVELRYQKAYEILEILNYKYYQYAMESFDFGWLKSISSDDKKRNDFWEKTVESLKNINTFENDNYDLPDVTKTIYWLERSVKFKGSNTGLDAYDKIRSYSILGDIYYYGFGGIDVDEKKANHYYKLVEKLEEEIVSEIESEE